MSPASMTPRLPQPEITTQRLLLREIREDDAPALFAVHSDPQVMRYWSYPAWTRPEQAAQKIADTRQQRREQDLFVWALAEAASDRLIGSIAVFSIDQGQGRAEIGYSLHRDWQRQGLASEAMRAVLGFLFQTRQLRRIEADVDPRNTPSCRLLERLGFVREGLLRERWQVNGEICDTALYGLLRRDFKPN